MSGPTIRISDSGSFPEVSTVSDLGQTMEISNINDFDLGMLGNQSKIGDAPRSQGIEFNSVAADEIEFVNLEDTNVTFDIKPPSNTGDTIKILRDNSSYVSPPRNIENPTLSLNSGPQTSNFGSYNNPTPAPVHAPAPAPSANSWFSKLTGGGAAATESSNAGGFRSWFGAGSSESAPVTGGDPMRTYLTPEEEMMKKMEGLTMLERMDRKGVGGTKMTIANSLDEINAEVERRKDSKALEASIRFQRSMLTTVTNGMEFLNNRYDPFGVALDGWSESVHENLEDYDEIFEELYDKYKDKSKVAPEVRLIMSLGLSAAMCHVTNTMFKSKMPGMDDILRKNPDLARQMAQAAAAQAVGPGFANFVSMGMPSASNSRPPMAQSHMEEEDMGRSMGFMPPMGSGIGSQIPSMDPRGGVDMNPPTARREMRGPSGVDDILRTLNANGDMSQRSVPPTAIDADEIGSVNSGFTTDTMRRSGLQRKRKATTTQPTGATLTLNV